MGFSEKAAARALKRHRNMDMAVNFLLEVGEAGLDDSSEGGAAEGTLPLRQATRSNPWPNRAWVLPAEDSMFCRPCWGNPERQLPPLMRNEREEALQPAVPVTNPDSDPDPTNASTEEYLQMMQNAEDQELARAIQLSLQGT
eukprot:gene4832-5901_t